MHTHSKKSLNKRLSQSWWQLFSETRQEGSADGEIHATREHNNITTALKSTKKLRRAIQNKRHGVLLHDNVCLHTVACTWALLEHFNRELFDHQFTHQKNWFRSHCLKNNEKLMEDVKMWFSSQVADLQKIFFFSHSPETALWVVLVAQKFRRRITVFYTYCHFISLQLKQVKVSL
jgi:hypothetical protein